MLTKRTIEKSKSSLRKNFIEYSTPSKDCKKVTWKKYWVKITKAFPKGAKIIEKNQRTFRLEISSRINWFKKR